MVRIRDAYDAAIDWLCEHRHELWEAWANTRKHRAGFLFAFAADDRHGGTMSCGCLTMIRYEPDRYSVYVGGRPAPELTAEIACDLRLPLGICNDTPREALEAIADRQRWLDNELGREPPVWKDDEQEEDAAVEFLPANVSPSTERTLSCQTT